PRASCRVTRARRRPLSYTLFPYTTLFRSVIKKLVWRRTVVKRRHVRQDLHPNVGGSHETSHAVLRQWRQKNDVIQLFSACPLLQDRKSTRLNSSHVKN